MPRNKRSKSANPPEKAGSRSSADGPLPAESPSLPVRKPQPQVNATVLAPQPESDTPLTVFQYLVLNAVFYAFCLLVLGIVSLTLQETRGLWYFFGLIMVSFSVVSIYDFLYDRLSRPEKVGQ